MYPVEYEAWRFCDFVAQARLRYPELKWEQCEIWLEEDWSSFEPRISWLLARCYVLEAWMDGCEASVAANEAFSEAA